MTTPGADRVARWLVPRARLVGTAAAAGFVAGGGGVAALAVAAGDVRFASTQVFSLGALLFGFALLGWSGSVMLGRGVESMQRHLDTGTGWTEADSRRAMARIGGVGAGVMVGTAATATVLAGT